MEFTTKSISIAKQRTPCAIVGVYETQRLTPSAEALDKASRGHIVNVLKRGDMKGSPGQTLMLYDVPRTDCERILLVGLGKQKELDPGKFRKALGAMGAALAGSGIREAVCCLPEVEPGDRDLSWRVRQTVEATQRAVYRFDRLKSEKDDNGPRLRKLALNIPEGEGIGAARDSARQGQAIANGTALAKDLGNLPGNICTPEHLANEARRLARGKPKLKTQVLTEKDIEKLKMGAFLSVTRGSRQPPRLIVMRYEGGRKNDRPYVLVGKGITFDSGGISIKPSAAMDEMKYDMCGAASVLGTMAAVTEMELPINVIGVVPACENLPDGDASKPGDIVTSMSGQTVEVLNTDAEGRLILCDALTYSEQFKPQAVIDIATLTGACVIALGKHASGLLGNDEALVGQLLQAGQSADDRAWELPLWDEYQEQLKSNFADMANVGGREAGTITAASFLSRFTRKYAWAHLDIAGVAWLQGAEKGATGRPVPLLSQYLIDRSESA